MAKKATGSEQALSAVPREAIAAVRSAADFVDFLRRQLDWPIPEKIARLDDVTIPHDLQKRFGFTPQEDRIAVSHLLSLAEDQPWGVFLFEFKSKRAYLPHLRCLLRALGSRRVFHDPIWNHNDHLFICTSDWREYQFVYVAGGEPESAVITTFGWEGLEDPFLDTLCRHNLARLRMPQPGAVGDYNSAEWRAAWRDAFSIKPLTDEFYVTLKEVFNAVHDGVTGLEGEDRRLFAELVVNRMVFLKFVERKAGWTVTGTTSSTVSSSTDVRTTGGTFSATFSLRHLAKRRASARRSSKISWAMSPF